MNSRESTANISHAEQMRRFLDAGIYLVTSVSMSPARPTMDIVQAALDAGIRLIQLREKDLSTRELFRLACKTRELTHAVGALLIINDRVDIAVAVGADGVHLGQDDLPIREARRLAPNLIIGASSHSRVEALAAETEGASYVNIGPLFPTETKKWPGEFLGLDGLRRISAFLSIPFTVMGGIKKSHIPGLVAGGARVIAVVTAITAADAPGEAAKELLRLVRSGE